MRYTIYTKDRWDILKMHHIWMLWTTAKRSALASHRIAHLAIFRDAPLTSHNKAQPPAFSGKVYSQLITDHNVWSVLGSGSGRLGRGEFLRLAPLSPLMAEGRQLLRKVSWGPARPSMKAVGPNQALSHRGVVLMLTLTHPRGAGGEIAQNGSVCVESSCSS